MLSSLFTKGKDIERTSMISGGNRAWDNLARLPASSTVLSGTFLPLRRFRRLLAVIPAKAGIQFHGRLRGTYVRYAAVEKPVAQAERATSSALVSLGGLRSLRRRGGRCEVLGRLETVSAGSAATLRVDPRSRSRNVEGEPRFGGSTGAHDRPRRSPREPPKEAPKRARRGVRWRRDPRRFQARPGSCARLRGQVP